MKNINYKELPEVFDDATVKILRIMESEQTLEWLEVFDKMTLSQWEQYESIKLKQRREEKAEIRQIMKGGMKSFVLFG